MVERRPDEQIIVKEITPDRVREIMILLQETETISAFELDVVTQSGIFDTDAKAVSDKFTLQEVMDLYAKDLSQMELDADSLLVLSEVSDLSEEDLISMLDKYDKRLSLLNNDFAKTIMMTHWQSDPGMLWPVARTNIEFIHLNSPGPDFPSQKYYDRLYLKLFRDQNDL